MVGSVATFPLLAKSDQGKERHKGATKKGNAAASENGRRTAINKHAKYLSIITFIII